MLEIFKMRSKLKIFIENFVKLKEFVMCFTIFKRNLNSLMYFKNGIYSMKWKALANQGDSASPNAFPVMAWMHL